MRYKIGNQVTMDNLEGSGTKQDPYKIKNIIQLQAVNRELDAYYELISDIDATNVKSEEFEPIGDRENPFTGAFDGGGYQIANLCIEEPEQRNIGLFGCIGEEGRIENLDLRNSTIEGKSSVGGLVGLNEGIIESSNMQGVDIYGRQHIGGLVGSNKNDGQVESSYTVKVDVSGDNHVGGLVGWNPGGVETSYTVKVDVSGDEQVGGLVGRNSGGVETSYTVKVDVSGDEEVGGLIGYNVGKVERSYTVKVDLSGEEYVCSLIGFGESCREGCFTVSSSNEPKIPEEPDLMMSRKDHRILYDVETSVLFAQVNGELYSRENVSPIEVQSLVDETDVVKMTDRFKASVVSAIQD